LIQTFFLYALLYDVQAEPKAERARQILLSIEHGELLASTSTFTWDEVVWVTSKVMGKIEGISQGGSCLGFQTWILLTLT
jgi:predicted nucleic acid-binding protein